MISLGRRLARRFFGAVARLSQAVADRLAARIESKPDVIGDPPLDARQDWIARVKERAPWLLDRPRTTHRPIPPSASPWWDGGGSDDTFHRRQVHDNGPPISKDVTNSSEREGSEQESSPPPAGVRLVAPRLNGTFRDPAGVNCPAPKRHPAPGGVERTMEEDLSPPSPVGHGEESDPVRSSPEQSTSDGPEPIPTDTDDSTVPRSIPHVGNEARFQSVRPLFKDPRGASTEEPAAAREDMHPEVPRYEMPKVRALPQHSEPPRSIPETSRWASPPDGIRSDRSAEPSGLETIPTAFRLGPPLPQDFQPHEDLLSWPELPQPPSRDPVVIERARLRWDRLKELADEQLRL